MSPVDPSTRRGPHFLRLEELADVLDKAADHRRSFEHGMLMIIHGTSAQGRPFRVTQEGSDGCGVFEWLPIIGADSGAWA